MANLLPEQKLGYPSSDGKPMAETGIHVQTILMLHAALQDFFKDRPDVFIASDMFWYWELGNPKARTAPDVMIVPGVGNHHRRSFFSWEENGAVPRVVFEMASQSTWKKDLKSKRARYRKLSVPEYVIFDPEALYLPEPLMGFQLKGTRYIRMPLAADGSLGCSLGFRVRPEGIMLRLIDAVTGEPFPTQAEQAAAAEANAAAAEANAAAAEANAAAEKARADALAAEVERLKALLQNQGSTNGPTP